MDAGRRIILHCDCDHFFVQVEQLRDPTLAGKPIAIQQHQDIIAANPEAKTAGVQKHMAPAEARAILNRVGGRVVHVFCEDGRVSYRPYRELSAAIMRLLKQLPAAAVVEKASIDEASVQLHPATSHQGPDGGSSSEQQQRMQRGLQVAQELRARVKQELGVAISVGVSFNKLLAKLASKRAKPDGVFCIPPDEQAIMTCLASTNIDQLPGMGGRVAASLAAHGVTTCSSLAARLKTHPQLVHQLGLPPAKAALLARYCQGDDVSEVVDKGPPRTFQVQMTLTPVPIPAPPTTNPTLNGPQHPGDISAMLQPLPVRGPDTRARLSRLLHHMCRDLVPRVILDRHQEGRWPSKLVVQLTCQLPTHTGPPGAGSTTSTNTSRTTAFPSASLLEGPTGLQPVTTSVQGPVQTHAESAAVGATSPSGQGRPQAGVGAGILVARPHLVVSERTFDVPSVGAGGDGAAGDARVEGIAAVLQAVHSVAEGVAVALLQQPPASWVVTQVALAASGLLPWEQANAPTIRRFMTKPAALDQQKQEPVVPCSEQATLLPTGQAKQQGLELPPAEPKRPTLAQVPAMPGPRKPSASTVGPLDGKVHVSKVFDDLGVCCSDLAACQALHEWAQGLLDVTLLKSSSGPRVFRSAWQARAAPD